MKLFGVATPQDVGIVKRDAGGKNSDVRYGIYEDFSPKQILLYQNYPNPFNPTTTIRFEIPVGAIHELPLQTTLKIYNVLGQEVATLLNNEEIEEGMHEVQFDASGLSSGIYFYRLRAGTFLETKKMILMK
ncbi:MAG: T9SS type A sorting domain-containing protein [Ignavibacteria bacterium]|nr:T9SS type A sorting domain-containing protein [Ignavibacteria bacterium]